MNSFRTFYDLALQLLNECHSRNEILTQHLITKNLINWGEQTCCSIAVKSNHSDFITHASFEDILSRKWNGDLKIPGNVAGIVRDVYLLLCWTKHLVLDTHVKFFDIFEILLPYIM